MTTNGRITIKEIASEAGISKQTVSRVLNDRPDVAPATRQRVQAIIDRYGYQPSQLARSLTRGRTCTIGVVTSDLRHFGPSQVLTGIEQQANTFGYRLSLSLLHTIEDDQVETILGDMLAHHVEGIIWAAVWKVGQPSQRILQRLSELATPVVTHAESHTGLTTVRTDEAGGAAMATQHLIEQGYRTIGIITGPLDEWSSNQRLAGWRNTLQAAGLEPDQSLVVAGDWTAFSGACGLPQLLQRRPDMDALFVSNDQMALGVLRAAQELGRTVPRDLGVVGFDDIPEAAFFTPPLTTIRQDVIEKGRLQVQELDRAIQARIQREPYEPRTVLIAPQLIVRDSANPTLKARLNMEVMVLER